jgi:hypothetical protein
MKLITLATLIVLFIAAMLGVFTGLAHAEPTIVYQNKCIDETNWDCRNKIQGATRAETRRQVNQACRGIKCPVIFSIDPIRPDWSYGAWYRKGKVYFAADPGGCPNALRELRRLLLSRSSN